MRVLLIEDDTAMAKSIDLMLQGDGFNVYGTDLGEEGLDLGKIYDYDIIVLDRLCNLTSGNSFGVCALSPTEGHAPQWGDPFSWYSMKETNQPWRTKYAERAGYGD